MMHPFNRFWLDSYGEREWRLCYRDPEVIKEGAWFVSGITGYFADLFGRDNKEEAENQLHVVSGFANIMPPTIQEHILKQMDAGNVPGKEAFGRLFDIKNWTEEFKNLDWATDPAQPMSIHDGPRGILRGMEVSERREVYYEFVSKVISYDVLNDESFASVFGSAQNAVTAKHATKNERLSVMMQPKNLADISQAMDYILGITDPNDTDRGSPAYRIAATSLIRRYRRIEDDGTGSRSVESLIVQFDPTTGAPIVRGGGLNDPFHDDAAEASRGELFVGDIQSLRHGLTPSFIKGALNPNMGVLIPEDTDALREILTRKQVESTLNQDRSRDAVREYTGVVKLEKARESETLAEKFLDLSPIEKIALIGIALFALSNSKVRMGAVGLGIMYFGQKFLLNHKDPINDTWKPVVQGLTDFVVGMPGMGWMDKDLDQYTDEELAERGRLMGKFLSEHTRNNLDSATTGFTLIADMSLSNLAQHFFMSQDGSLATLRFDNPDFRREIERLTVRHGLKRSAARMFFQDGANIPIENEFVRQDFGADTYEKHAKDAGDALATVFYMFAIRDPKHRRAFDIIEHYRGRNSFGTYEDLPDEPLPADTDGDGQMEYVNPRELYAHLVRVGKQAAIGSNMTLLEFVQQDMLSETGGVQFVSSNQPKEARTPNKATNRAHSSTSNANSATNNANEAASDVNPSSDQANSPGASSLNAQNRSNESGPDAENPSARPDDSQNEPQNPNQDPNVPAPRPNPPAQ